MTRLVTMIISGVALLLILAAVGMWVAGWGPFHSPSAAEKELPKVQASVAKAQDQQAASAEKAEIKTQHNITAIEKRTESHVAKVRAAPPELSDREWFAGVCASLVYAADPACRGSSGRPKG